ncbi:MAG: iron chelate uptake ABC transporter family permease subunit [Butyricicoccus sp.]
MKPQPKMRYAGAFAVLLALLAVLFVWNVNSGSLHLSVREVAQILLTHSGDNAVIVWEIRMPRIFAAILLGGALSVSGFLLQTFFANPIAGPFVLGISSGAKLTVALTMIGAVLRARARLCRYDNSRLCGSHALDGLCAAHRAARAADAAAGCERRDDWLYLLGGDGLRHYLC